MVNLLVENLTAEVSFLDGSIIYILVGFPIFSLLLSALEFGLVNLIEFSSDSKIDVALKILSIVIGCLLGGLIVALCFLTEAWIAYVGMGIGLGMHIIYLIVLTILRFKYNNSDNKYF